VRGRQGFLLLKNISAKRPGLSFPNSYIHDETSGLTAGFTRFAKRNGAKSGGSSVGRHRDLRPTHEKRRHFEQVGNGGSFCVLTHVIHPPLLWRDLNLIFADIATESTGRRYDSS